MVRVLHLDVTRGATAGDVLAALVDLGVAPSPILHALGSLGLPAHLVIEDKGGGHLVSSHPGEAPVHVRPRDVREWLARSDVPPVAAHVAEEAVERLVEATGVPEEGACVARHAMDAGTLLCVVGASIAAVSVGASEVTVSRVPVEEDPPGPLVDLLAQVAESLDFGAAEPISEDAAALLRALADERAFGRGEPEWKGVVSRGASVGGVRALLGEV